MSKYSLSDIKSSFAQKRDWDRQYPVSYFIFRPLSFYITFIALKVTQSPSKVAFIGFTIGLLGNISFLFSDRFGILPGILLLMLCALSDAVDGNIARTTKNVTYYGKYLDSVLGAVAEGIFPFMLGLGLYYFYDTSIYLNPFGLFETDLRFLMLICGAVIMTGIIYSTRIGMTYDYQSIQKVKDTGMFKETLSNKIGTSTYSNNMLYLIFENLNAFNFQLVALLIFYSSGMIDVFMLLFACYYILRFLIHSIYYTVKAGHELK